MYIPSEVIEACSFNGGEFLISIKTCACEFSLDITLLSSMGMLGFSLDTSSETGTADGEVSSSWITGNGSVDVILFWSMGVLGFSLNTTSGTVTSDGGGTSSIGSVNGSVECTDFDPDVDWDVSIGESFDAE